MRPLADEGRRAVQALSQELCGELAVWVGHGMARGWTTRVPNDFLACHPGMSLNLRLAPPADCRMRTRPTRGSAATGGLRGA